MTAAWLPNEMNSHEYGDFDQYFEAVYQCFRRDFIHSRVFYKGSLVSVLPNRIEDGKHFTFWHIVGRKDLKGERKICLRRCARVPWIKPIIQNYHQPEVTKWYDPIENKFKFWLQEERHLVVLKETTRGNTLITSFPTDGGYKKSLADEFRRAKSDGHEVS